MWRFESSFSETRRLEAHHPPALRCWSCARGQPGRVKQFLRPASVSFACLARGSAGGCFRWNKIFPVSDCTAARGCRANSEKVYLLMEKFHSQRCGGGAVSHFSRRPVDELFGERYQLSAFTCELYHHHHVGWLWLGRHRFVVWDHPSLLTETETRRVEAAAANRLPTCRNGYGKPFWERGRTGKYFLRVTNGSNVL